MQLIWAQDSGYNPKRQVSMSLSAVNQILQSIESLPARDRERLDQELTIRAEREWKRLVKAARPQARKRGISQSTIDRAVERFRYSSR